MNNGLRTIFMIGVTVSVIGLAPCFSFAQKANTAGFKNTLQNKRNTIKTNTQNRRDTIKGTVQDKKDALLQKAEERHNDIKSKLEVKKTEFKAMADKRRAKLGTKIGADKAQNVEASFGNIADRLDKELGRLNDLAGKLHDEITKRDGEGQDVSQAAALLDKATAEVGDAQKALDTLKQKYADMTAAKDPQAAFKSVKTAVNDVVSKMQDAHKLLMAVVPALKSAGSANATSTPPGVLPSATGTVSQ